MNPTSSSCKKTASMVLTDTDVMIDILIRLPLKSLLKTKCVCKWWNKLISDPLFISIYSRQNPENHYVSGFFLQKFLFLERYSKLEFFTCGGRSDAAPQPSLSFIEDESGVYIRHSCNGLLLCSSFRCLEEDRKYYICKPTTQQYRPLPKPECETVFGINMVYDPKISNHYKVICVCDSKLSKDRRKIQIYESDSGTWRDSTSPQFIPHDLLLNQGVLWNGALHWVGRGKFSLRFDVVEEHMLIMPMPPILEGISERRLAYFGESGSHLYLIETYGPRTTTFNVMEMRSDYSGWFAKYHVNLDGLTHSFPSMTRNNMQDIDGFMLQDIHRFMFSVLYIVDRRDGDVDESYMVIHIPGKFISYNLKEGRFEEYKSFSYEMKMMEASLGLWYSWEGVYPYINTLCYL